MWFENLILTTLYPDRIWYNPLMTTKQIILKEINKISEPILEEVLDFIRFLENKSLRKASETAILSEVLLAKDWLKPEEDKAWQNL